MGERGTRHSALDTRRLRELVESVAPVVGSEAADLVAACFDQPRHWPALNADAPVSDADWAAVLVAARKRASGAPLQYAVGKANFRNLTLSVDERVLIPRPETEQLVDLVLEHARRGGAAVDVGTGSGAVAIALAAEGSFDRVVATDISLDALDVARANASRSGATIEFVHADLLGSGRSLIADYRFSAVVSNPPYITFDEARQLPLDVRNWEPVAALFSPRDGMLHTERLVAQAAPALADGGLLALEVDSRRASLVTDLVARDARFTDVSLHLDLSGRERFVLAVRRRRSTHD